MTDEEPESGEEQEEQIDESGRNPTQQDIDERGADDAPVDVPWETKGGHE